MSSSMVVPAAPGCFGVAITVLSASKRPTENDIQAVRLPVIAWRIAQTDGQSDAQPIVPGIWGSDTKVLIELPDGRLDDPEERIYDDLNSARADVLWHAQNDWDRQQREREEQRG